MKRGCDSVRDGDIGPSQGREHSMPPKTSQLQRHKTFDGKQRSSNVARHHVGQLNQLKNVDGHGR